MFLFYGCNNYCWMAMIFYTILHDDEINLPTKSHPHPTPNVWSYVPKLPISMHGHRYSLATNLTCYVGWLWDFAQISLIMRWTQQTLSSPLDTECMVTCIHTVNFYAVTLHIYMVENWWFGHMESKMWCWMAMRLCTTLQDVGMDPHAKSHSHLTLNV